ncbi:MAG: integrase [Proteobacteria bacterium]|nr:MAG: integrase [Pseudomonadota bacterium]
MKYPLDCEENVQKSLLFWLSRFVKYKLNSLSNKELKDPPTLARVTFALTKGVGNLEELDILVKKARNAGMTGINTYFNPLKKMLEMFSLYNLYSLKQIDEELISDFLASSTGGLSDATKKNYRIAILSFFSYLDKQNEEDGKAHVYDISLKHWRGLSGKSGEKLPEFLNEDELEKFLQAIEDAKFKTNGDRNKLIIKMICYTGMRVSEALNIKQRDISDDREHFIIRIRGKGNKYRIVMIKKSIISTLLSNVLKTTSCKNGLVFCNRSGNKMTQAYVSRIVEQILFQAGIRKEKNGAHMLRHTFATLLYRKRKDIVLVQEALGHASLNTSRIYTHFDNERLKEAASVAEDLAVRRTES